MKWRSILSVFAITLCAGCGSTTTPAPTSVFFTATLPPTPTAQATQTAAPPVAIPTATDGNITPVEGMTTAQVNVRAEPSTASASLGLIGIFIKVQVSGRDESQSWYQIVYAESQTGKGWVRAEYVQVNDAAGIRLVETESGSGAVSGLIIQKVNVRGGPGIEFDLLGVLNSNDLVFITARDAGGKWLQIEFAGAPDGKGWVTAEFLQVGSLDRVPIAGGIVTESTTPADETPQSSTPSEDPTALLAAQDGDSMQSPLTAVIFSVTGSRALQFNGDVSLPQGDAEDWIQFKSRQTAITIKLTCAGSDLRAELWNHEKPLDGFSCGESFTADILPQSDYFLRLAQNESGYTRYIMKLEVIR